MMVIKRSFFMKFIIYTALAIIIITVGSHSFGYDWSNTFGGTEHEEGRSVQQTTDGGFIIAGYTTSFGAGRRDVYLFRTAADGRRLWSRTFGGTDYDRAFSVQQTDDGGYIITGYTSSFGAGIFDVYLIYCRDGFADVPPWYWAQDYIYAIFNAGITQGCSQNPLRYCREASVTRAQMAAFLARAFLDME